MLLFVCSVIDHRSIAFRKINNPPVFRNFLRKFLAICTGFESYAIFGRMGKVPSISEHLHAVITPR